MITNNNDTQMKVEQTKEAIIDLVKRLDNVTFVEVERELEKKGLVIKKEDPRWCNDILSPPPYENIVVWCTRNELMADAIIQLQDEKPKRLFMKPDGIIGGIPFSYLAAGGMLHMPIANDTKPSKTKKWIPLLLTRS